MARIKVVHSQDACALIFKGDKKYPEPSTGIIKFPGGHVEVSRTSDGLYWAHVSVDDSSNIVNSRIDYDQYVEYDVGIRPIPHENHIKKLAIKVQGSYKEV